MIGHHFSMKIEKPQPMFEIRTCYNELVSGMQSLLPLSRFVAPYMSKPLKCLHAKCELLTSSPFLYNLLSPPKRSAHVPAQIHARSLYETLMYIMWEKYSMNGYAPFKPFLIKPIHSMLINQYVHRAFMNSQRTQESVIFG
jgi:hypothetical protein